ncbi:fumarylacetoacetase [Novosphingobium olei]|nr:fumarylacetoacetase [Novosphingobium olei]
MQNLPLGVFSHGDGIPRIGTAIGDWVLDLSALDLGQALREPTLNALFALPVAERRALRLAIFAYLTDAAYAATAPLLPMAECVMHLPFRIGDYTDFYVGIHHATAIGALFRPDNPLLPNYKHVPIGYHGRASSVRVSGAPVRRPVGQIKPPAVEAPIHAPCQRLDYELELGVWIAGDSDLGETIPIDQAWNRIGGLCLLNDWSARDIQAWEYQPLGPFLAKNFLTTISPWVVTVEALAPFRAAPVPRPSGDPAPLPYLAELGAGGLSIEIGASILTPAMRAAGLPPHALSHGNAREAMYWTAAQIVTHHASNGCDLHAGDLLGTGTLSGPTAESAGSLMELSSGGKVPISLPHGETRSFLLDGDELLLHARAVAGGYRSIGFGPCRGVVLG